MEGKKNKFRVKVRFELSEGAVPREKLIISTCIHHECEGRIEKSVPRITDWDHEACRKMTNGDHEGRIFLPHPHTNSGFFFSLTTRYLISYSKYVKKTSSTSLIRCDATR